MITQEQKKRISYKLSRVGFMGRVRDGKCYYENNEAEIPSLENLIESTMNMLQTMVISSHRVSPAKANCVVRIYRHENYKIDSEIYWMYGVVVYWKECFGRMYTIERAPINYEDFSLKTWFYQDECVHLRPNFVDIYLKIE